MTNNNNNKNIYSMFFLIVFIFTMPLASLSLLPQFVVVNGQVDPSQEQIEPIPPSNNTNPDSISPMMVSQ